MTDKVQKLPSAEHPIAILLHDARIVVRAGEIVIADTTRARALKEAAYPVVFYIPRADIQMALLEQTAQTTYCPYKGSATYFSVPIAGDSAANIAWSYERSYDAVGAVAGHIAFYPDRVLSIEEWETAGRKRTKR